MNWKKFALVGGVALATITIPLATVEAQGRAGGGRGQPGASMRGSAGLPSARSWNSGSGRSNSGGNRWSNGTNRGNSGRWNNGNGRWSNNGRWHHRHHHHHRHFPRSYYGGFYPYGFGYPFGYGYGYGYPYFASTALYHNGYHSGYRGSNSGDGNLAVNVQQELARAGYYRGAIDGVIGDGTRRAIRAFERANGLPVDGRIDRQLLETMGLS